MHTTIQLISTGVLLVWSLSFIGCNKINELREDPDIAPIQEGFKASAAIGYCTSLATMAFQGQTLPSNVIFETGSSSEFSQSGILYVDTQQNGALPFNDHIDDIIIAGIWDNDQESGVISIIFGNLDIFRGKYQFYGIHTVPVKRKFNSERFITAFAQQDIVIGQGSDTLLNIGMNRIQFDKELERLEEDQPHDVFAAVKQNVWFVQFYQNQPDDVYDDSYEINGGGQIVEATNTEGGVMYHALIETKFNVMDCNLNPNHGSAFIQNIKAGEGIDLGNIFIDFHSTCNGQGNISFATGEYLKANGSSIDLNLN